MDLAERIKERINQYYSATDSVTHSGVSPLVSQCQKSLEDLEKLFGGREALRFKLEASSKDLAELRAKADAARGRGSPFKDTKKLQGRPR